MKLICSPITSGDKLSSNLGFVSLIDKRICVTFKPREELLLHCLHGLRNATFSKGSSDNEFAYANLF